MNEYYAQNARYPSSKMDEINDTKGHAGDAEEVIENDNQAWNALIDENRARALSQCETKRIQGKDYLIPSEVDEEMAINLIFAIEFARQDRINTLMLAYVCQSDSSVIYNFYDTLWKIAVANQLTALPHIYGTLMHQTQYDGSNIKTFFDTLLDIEDQQVAAEGIVLFGLRVPSGMNLRRAIKVWYMLNRMNNNIEQTRFIHSCIEKCENKQVVIDTIWELALNNALDLNPYVQNLVLFAQRSDNCSNSFLHALFQLNNNMVGDIPQLDGIQRPQGMLPTRVLSLWYLTRRMNEDAKFRRLMHGWIKIYPGNEAVTLLWEFRMNNLENNLGNLDLHFAIFIEFAQQDSKCSNSFLRALLQLNNNMVGDIPQLGEIKHPQGMLPTRVLSLWYLTRRMNEDAEFRRLMHGWIRIYPGNDAITLLWEFILNNLDDNLDNMNSYFENFIEFAQHNRNCSNLFFDALFQLNKKIQGNVPGLMQIQYLRGMRDTSALNYWYLIRHMNEHADHRYLIHNWIKSYPENEMAVKTLWMFTLKNTQDLSPYYRDFAEFALHGRACFKLFLDALFTVNRREGINIAQMGAITLPVGMAQSTALSCWCVLNNTIADRSHLVDVVKWLKTYQGRKSVLKKIRAFAVANRDFHNSWNSFMVMYNLDNVPGDVLL